MPAQKIEFGEPHEVKVAAFDLIRFDEKLQWMFSGRIPQNVRAHIHMIPDGQVPFVGNSGSPSDSLKIEIAVAP